MHYIRATFVFLPAQLLASPVFRGETVWAVTADELGVQRVVRFEARPTP